MVTMSMRLKKLIPRKASKIDNNDRNGGSGKEVRFGGEVLAVSAPPGSQLGQVVTQRAASRIMSAHKDVLISAPLDGVADGKLCTSYSSDTTPYSLYFEFLPSFRDVPSSERQDLLLKKLGLCSYIFEFVDAIKNIREKEIKRQTLLELVDYVTSATERFSDSIIQNIAKMVASNIFRPFPPVLHNSNLDTFAAEEEEPLKDPAWPHLQIVYEFFLRFIVSPETDAKVAKRYIDHSFVLKLLDLFDSEDPRERDYLKTILHRVYGKFMVYRPFIRKAINNIFYYIIFENERHNGISELLEILGSIIVGFAVPLKEEHKLVLRRVLLPLHKPKSASVYHHQLSCCISHFIEKDSKLADDVVRGLLKYWPLTNSQKELLFLGELEEVLESTQSTEFQKCMVPLFRQIAKCLNSQHFQVAERALFLWSNDYIMTLIAQNRHAILPVIFNSLEMNAKGHWNLPVQGLTQNVRKMFLALDPDLFQECHRQFELEEQEAKSLEQKQGNLWERLEAMNAFGSFSSSPIILEPRLKKIVVAGYCQVAAAEV